MPAAEIRDYQVAITTDNAEYQYAVVNTLADQSMTVTVETEVQTPNGNATSTYSDSLVAGGEFVVDDFMSHGQTPGTEVTVCTEVTDVQTGGGGGGGGIVQ